MKRVRIKDASLLLVPPLLPLSLLTARPGGGQQEDVMRDKRVQQPQPRQQQRGTEAGARQRSPSQSQEIKLCLIVKIMQSLELHSGTR